MTRRASRAPSQRQLRVGEELRHALAWVLERGEVRDPGLKGMSLTVTEVRMSPDLRRATVFFTPLGGGAWEAVQAALQRARPFLRRRVGDSVRLKYVPDMVFVPDRSFDQVDHIDRLLQDPSVARDLSGDDKGEDHGP